MKTVLHATILGLVLLAAGPAFAANLVGVWEGKWKCSEVDGATGEQSTSRRRRAADLADAVDQP
jgi:hypothetical protein